MFNFGNYLTKNAITFDLTEIERKIRYLVDMKFCYASNAASKNIKITKKKTTFFPKYFRENRHFFKKYRFLEKIRYIFGFWKFFRHFDYLFTCLSLIVKLWINYLQHHVKFTKSYENYVNFKFWDPPPLRLNLDPKSKKNFATRC